jgi:hydrogenase nickel incorporation protein HypB
MCGTCGCSAAATVRLLVADRPGNWSHNGGADRTGVSGHSPGQITAANEHDHAAHEHHAHAHDRHAHADHSHEHIPVLDPTESERTIELQQRVLAKNDDLAEQNRRWLRERGVFAINLMSSPGAGKTTLLERTSRDLAGLATISVIEGDQETALDGRRILSAGSKVVQINTGAGCHLDADMVARGLRELDPPTGSIVIIENVGNLVCPALFNLGEETKVVLASVAEGADKPMKYPHMFRTADLVLLNKVDLLPYVQFDLRQYASDLRKVTPDSLMLQVSATTGEGMQGWYDWLRRRTPAPRD